MDDPTEVILEKECAMRSPRVAAKGFEPARELTRDEVQRRFPLLPMPRLASSWVIQCTTTMMHT